MTMARPFVIVFYFLSMSFWCYGTSLHYCHFRWEGICGCVSTICLRFSVPRRDQKLLSLVMLTRKRLMLRMRATRSFPSVLLLRKCVIGLVSGLSTNGSEKCAQQLPSIFPCLFQSHFLAVRIVPMFSDGFLFDTRVDAI